MTRDGPMSLSELRERSLKLSTKQAELRSRLSTHLEASGANLGATARMANSNWATLNAFMTGKLSMCSGRSLQGLCALLECPDLGREIEELAAPIPDYQRSLGCFSASIIKIAIDLMVAQQENANLVTYTEFAECFGEHAATVRGALKGSAEALQQLASEEVQNDVIRTLIENLDERLEIIVNRRTQAQAVHVTKLKTLVDQLLVSYHRKTVITKKLGIGPTALHNALAGRSSISQLEMVIARAEALLDEDPRDPAVRFKDLYEVLYERYGSQQAVATALDIKRESLRTAFRGKNRSQATLIARAEALLATASSPTASVVTDRSNVDAVSEPPIKTDPSAPIPQGKGLLETFGGVNTEEGVQYVITRESFQELADIPLIELRDALVRSLTTSRGLLNIGSQNADAQARKILQKEVGKQLKELELAIRAFTFAHPSELLELFDDQREVWRTGTGKSETTKKGTVS